MITGLALDPSTDNQFVSVSEDQYVNMWQVTKMSLTANTLSAELVRSHRIDNKLCTGVSYLENGNIAVSCYEEDDITIITK